MSRHNSKASSFDPYDYYKKLTNCLADKNNFKVNRRSIPGMHKNNKRVTKPLITRQEIQAKFLAKHNEKRQQREPNEQSSRSLRANEISQNKKLHPLQFNVKLNQNAPKRKREPEYINLPNSFFHSFDGPDLSIFKKPEVPILKKQKDPEPTPSNAQSINLTMATVNSAAFKPKETSTPFEKPQPIITDPDDILSIFLRSSIIYDKEKSQSVEVLKKSFAVSKNKQADISKVMPKAVKATKENLYNIKAKQFLELADKTAKKIDAKCFSNQPNPIKEIRSRVMAIYDAFSQSPRLINETLMSSKIAVDESPQLSPVKYSSLPVPKFYENVQNKKSEVDPRVPKTCDIFNYSAKLGAFNLYNDQPAINEDLIFSPKFNLDESADYLFNSPEMSPFSQIVISPADSFHFNDSLNIISALEAADNIFDFSPVKVVSMDWAAPEAKKMDNTFAVFRSPPVRKPRQYRSQPFEVEQMKASQRSRHPDSSLSTYKWSPNFGRVKEIDRSTGSSQPYFFEPRNVFKDSFELL